MEQKQLENGFHDISNPDNGNNGNTSEKKGNKFAQGFAAGVLSAVCAVLLIGATGVFWLRGRATAGEGGTLNLVNNTVRTKINELAQLIQLTYYEDTDRQEMADGLYKGLLESLDDPYSVYYTAEEYEEMMISASAQYYGIGAVLQQDPDTMQVKIVKIYDGTPAKEAGLKAEDQILSVGEIEAQSMELSKLVTHIRGEENSTVHLTVLREGHNTLEFDVTRGKVDVPTVEGEMLSGDIGYIMIAEFGKATAADFKEQVKTLQAQGMGKLIVDLRDNPGGMLDSVTEILDYILPEGLIVYTEDKNGNREELRSDAEHYLDLPIAVLVNGNSASSSEIFAGAIRDHSYGLLIGTTTYGKGVVQTVSPLSDNSAVKLTTAQYFTPKGENINGKGIKPDIKLKYKYTGPTDGEYDYTKDNQVHRAMKKLRQMGQ